MGIILLVMSIMLAGCRADLYSNLSEKDANQILAVLMENGISASKSGAEGSFAIRVHESNIAEAVAVLSAKGLPRDRSVSIGSVFEKSGIISSPFEDRVRYVYALGEDVAATLREIDGVISARVHVVLPEKAQFGSPEKPSSAAVFIKYEPTVDLEYMTPQIRRLVSSSIEGLDYSAVTVLLAEGVSRDREVQKVERSTVTVLPGLAVREADVLHFWRIIYVGGIVIAALILIILAFVAYFVFYRGNRGWFRAESADNSSDSVETT